MAMMTPADARRRMLDAVTTSMPTQRVPLARALGRTLGADLKALRTQPPFPASAMDGYAVKSGDLDLANPLHVIGEAAAGHPFEGLVRSGEAVRIFTGAPVPDGADTILIQENAQPIGAASIQPRQLEIPGRFVRPAGLDFQTGDMLLRAGLGLEGRHIGLAASMGHVMLPVRKQPRVAIISTGDELVPPGVKPKSGQIISSNAIALAGLVVAAGGVAIDMGVVPDNLDMTRAAIAAAAAKADIIVTSGGASVGDHDMVQAALTAEGIHIAFWKVAIRPGKPLMLGTRGPLIVLGLPGNPVSSTVCAMLFLQPMIRTMLGQPDAAEPRRETAILGRDLAANDLRQEYMRASLAHDTQGRWVATPFPSQDSSIQRLMAQADALLVRPPHAPAAFKGETCDIIRL